MLRAGAQLRQLAIELLLDVHDGTSGIDAAIAVLNRLSQL
ncbi:MAG: hypothetical protein CM15mP89_1790 [Gammaproteobacteria bacterium]|nr:MAG: hypothetical protein CM15mP89_1790 [Gammaproteobacteria bacterium]